MGASVPGPSNPSPMDGRPTGPGPVGSACPYRTPVPNTMAPPVRQPVIAPPPRVSQERRPNDMTRGFAIAGIVLAIIAAIFAMMPLWDDVSVFGVVGLALDVIAACSLLSDRNRTPVWTGTVVVAALLCVVSIVIVAVT